MRRTATMLVVAALVLALGGVAGAGDFTMVPSVLPGCGACTSPVGNVFGFTFLGTTFSHTSVGGDAVISVGDTFTDVGALSATSLKSDTATSILAGVSGLNVNWQLGAIFSLPGTITDVDTAGIHSPAAPLLSFSFTPGSKLQLYAEPINFGDPHATGDPDTIADGVLVGELEVLSGAGNLDFVTKDGNIDLVAQFTFVLDDFWKHLGVEIDLGTLVFLAITDSNNNVLGSAPTGAQTNFANFFGITTTATSTLEDTWLSNDGSVEFAVTASNPSALMLVGAALTCLGSVGVYRRRRSA